MVAVALGIAAGAAIVGGLLSTGAQRDAGKVNEAIAKNNAKIGRFRAAASIRIGAQQAQAVRDQVQKLKGSNRVGFATQNVQLESDVVQNTEAELSLLAEEEVLTTLNNAAMEAWGFEQGAQESILSGQLAQSSARFGAAGSLLSGIGQAAAIAQTPQAPAATTAAGAQ